MTDTAIDTTLGLVTLEEIKELFGISADNSTIKEPELNLYVNIASRAIESWCGRKFIEPAAQITEIFDGDGTGEYYVANRRVATGDTPTLKYWDGSDFVAVDASHSFTWANDSGLVYFTKGNKFGSGKRNYEITYKYGWAIASVPQDVKLACATIMRRKMRAMIDKKEGLSSEGFGDNTSTFDLTTIGGDVKMLLAPYRRVRIG